MNLILEKYQVVRLASEKICAPLRDEDYSAQPTVFVSPPKWHLAHSTWFFETFVLKKFKSNYQIFRDDFSFLFNSYYNGIGERVNRDQRGTLVKTTVTEVYAYRKHVDVQMQNLLSENISAELNSLVELGLNHEQQHQELLLTDIKYILGNSPLLPIYSTDFIESSQEQVKNSTDIKISEGLKIIGNSDNQTFCFDNETPTHQVYIQEGLIQNKLVTNQEYLEFINDGGYTNHEHWLSDGWAWIQEEKISSPLYWQITNGEWFSFQLNGLKKIQLDAPVTHVSFYEAAAYASWKRMRLPTEFEWESVADKLNWGQRWEWTYSAYLPYPGYKRAEGAVGEYNGKFMINQMVLRGASIATPQEHSRKTYRNFFHPHERWQFTGIRLAQ